MVIAARAPLFVPATRPDRFSKAAGSGADAIILDLEDAVAPAQKDEARQALATGFTDQPVIVRVNGRGTPWHAQDLERVAQLPVAAVMLPKSETVQDIMALRDALGRVPVIALVETARGMANARALAAQDGVVRLAFGSVDYCADLACDHSRDALLSARCELVLAARLSGQAAPLDGVTLTLSDPQVAHDDAAHARGLGMGGKLCIHPGQIAQVQRAFRPSPEQIAWAQRVLSAGEGAAQVEGAMVDEPVRLRARAILAAVG